MSVNDLSEFKYIMSSIYTEIILDHYQNPRNFGEIEDYTASAESANILCGDRLKVFVKIKDNIIEDIKFTGQGCAISIASASIITSFLKGKNVVELKKINKDFIISQLKVDLGVNRIKCALLIGEVISKLKI